MSRGARLFGGIGRAPTVLRTLRHLRFEQITAQVRHMLHGIPSPRAAEGPAARFAIEDATVPFLGPPAHVKGSDTAVELLAVSIPVSGEGPDWETTEYGPLVAYHLHQHEYLRTDAFDAEARARLISDWMNRHPEGTGWDPHPISLRLLCWGKLLLTPAALPNDDELRQRMIDSMAAQTACLVDGLEVRLQANHLLSNLLSIVWSGLLLEGSESPRWRSISPRFVEELGRQIHPDGGHEERSPMYHSLLFENVLDALNLCRAAGKRAPAGLEAALQSTGARMAAALAAMTHVDGEIALFGDSGFDVAALPEALFAYAERLGISAAAEAASAGAGRASVLLPQTGYLRLSKGGFDLIASVAAPSPAHQPGHAHCDALSFELSVDGRRLITDTGLYEYRPGDRRDRSRTTASHSTLQFGAEEQAEIWSAHRVGGRPKVELSAWDEAGAAEAICRGWAKGAPLHRRRFSIGDSSAASGGQGGTDAFGVPDSSPVAGSISVAGASPVSETCVEIVDYVEGDCGEVVSRLLFGPSWLVEIRGAVAFARDPGGVVEIDLPESFSWSVERQPYYPSFGRELSRCMLVGRGRGALQSTLRFRMVESGPVSPGSA